MSGARRTHRPPLCVNPALRGQTPGNGAFSILALRAGRDAASRERGAWGRHRRGSETGHKARVVRPAPGATQRRAAGFRTRPDSHGVRRAVQTRSSAQGNCSAKSLAASVMSSILHCSSILPCPPCLPPVILTGGGGLAMGGGRGHFSPAAIYCTATWCFALKGLRTTI